MALTVAFSGTKAVPGPGPGYLVWSYAVEAVPPASLQLGQPVALALPDTLDLRDPRQCGRVTFDNVHHWMPALMLSHAASRSPVL